MKLSIFDRFLLFLSMIVMFCVGVMLIVIHFVSDFASAGHELDVLFSQQYGMIILIALAVVIIAVSLKLFVAVFSSHKDKKLDDDYITGKHGSADNTTLVKSTDHGDIVISSNVIKDLAIRKAKMSDKVKDVSCRVEKQGDASKLFMRFILMSDTKIDDFIVPMQQEIKQYVEELTGTTISGVEIRIDANEQKHHMSSRVK